MHQLVAKSFQGFSKGHPCVGAKQIGERRGFFLTLQPSMETYSTAVQILVDLSNYYELSDLLGNIKTLAIVFNETPYSQDEFAARYWSFVQILHDVDCCIFEYDMSVSPNPSDPNFELNLAGRAVFTTTLNPRNPRRARGFMYPTWVMNQLSQFEYLRSEGQFEKWQQVIREHDAEIDPSGEPNPILSNHGSVSAANQLAGSKPRSFDYSPNAGADDRLRALARVRTNLRTESCHTALVDWFEANQRVLK